MTTGIPQKRTASRLLRRNPLHLETINQLRGMIVEGELAPGQRLFDADLSARLGVSPTPIHEALRVLTSEGLVEPIPGRGCRVTKITVDGICQLFESIAAVERTTTVFATQRMSADDIAGLVVLQDEIEMLFRDRDRPAYSHSNQRIHDAIVALSGNPILQKIYADLMVRVRRARYFAILQEDRWEQSVTEHAQILDAIRARDAEGAGLLMFHHVLGTGATLARNFDGAAKNDDVVSV